MKRLLPKSLFGQTLLILLAGLILSHAVGSWIYTADREQAVRTVGGFAAAQRVVNLTRLVQEAPIEWRERIVTALSDQTLRVSLSTQPSILGGANEDDDISRAIREFLAEQVPSKSAIQPLIAVSASEGSPFAIWHQRGPGWMMGHGPMMHGLGGFRSLLPHFVLVEGVLFAHLVFEIGEQLSRPLLGGALEHFLALAQEALEVRALGLAHCRGDAHAFVRSLNRLGATCAAGALPELLPRRIPVAAAASRSRRQSRCASGEILTLAPRYMTRGPQPSRCIT